MVFSWLSSHFLRGDDDANPVLCHGARGSTPRPRSANSSSGAKGNASRLKPAGACVSRAAAHQVDHHANKPARRQAPQERARRLRRDARGRCALRPDRRARGRRLDDGCNARGVCSRAEGVRSGGGAGAHRRPGGENEAVTLSVFLGDAEGGRTSGLRNHQITRSPNQAISVREHQLSHVHR